MIGKIISHYRILEKIGEGGMGEVYLAEDTKLERKVALKFLSKHLTSDEESLERFKREARAAAKLNHQNIVTIHEINEHEGNTYIAMEYIEGENVREKLKIKNAKLKISDVVNFATQICEGLQEAHNAGIIHRDIKPENILTDKNGRVKILDFGLARIKGTSKLTKEMVTTGTFAYMSPEQFQGVEVDHRTDIWSFGVVLFEMLTGELPFWGAYEASIMYAVLNEVPNEIRNLRKDVPKNLEKVIKKCLKKNREQRYKEIFEVLDDLRKPVTISITEEHIKSVAVLPFENMSVDAEQEYFCDGMTEEIINALTHIENLKVIARSSAFMFKGKHRDLREIGRKLGVEHLLEGSVRKSGNKLRITAQLIEADGGSHLWSEKFDREMEDIFNIQDEISLAIVDCLKIKLLGEEREALLKHSTTDEYAYNLYLQGRFFWNKLTLNDLKNAMSCFDKAIESDPDFALAYFGLADTYWMLHQVVPLTADDALPKTKDAAMRALEIDDTLEEAQALVGFLLFSYEWNWSEAEEYLKKAYSLNPRSGPVKMYYSAFLQYTGKKMESIKMMEETLETDPLSLVYNVNIGIRLFVSERYDDTIKKCEEILEIEQNFWPAYQYIGRSYINKLIYDKAEEALVKSNEIFGGVPETIPLLGYVYGKQGRITEAKEIINRLDEESDKIYIPAFYYSYIYNGLGDIDKTFEYFEKAIDERDPRIAWWIRDKLFTNLRNDRRYADVIRKLGMEFLEKELMEQFSSERQKPSIIVLPFDNMSPDPDQEYFSDGLTEEIITDLSQIHDLLVISRSSAMTFKGSVKKIKQIANEVNVRYVLEGSVRKAGNNLRITAQLIDANNDTHLWANKYNGTLEDVFDIQERVSQSIFQALKLKLTPEEKNRIGSHQIENLPAYECYLRAKHEYWKYTTESFDTALKLLNKGIELIGDNVLLLSSIGDVYYGYIDIGEKPESYSKEAEAIAEKIFALEPDSSHAHRILGMLYFLKDRKKANTHFKKALKANPNNPDLLVFYGWVLTLMWGKPIEASPLVERLLKIDPITPFNNLVKACWHIAQGQFDLALETIQKYVQIEPQSMLAKSSHAEGLGFTHSYDQAVEVCDKIIHDEPAHIFAFIFKFLKFAFLGEKEKALRLVEEDPRSKLIWEDAEKSREIAEGFSILGEKDKSLDWLENAINRGNINYPLFNEIDPHLENIRSEERFKKLMERVKKDWEDFEV